MWLEIRELLPIYSSILKVESLHKVDTIMLYQRID